MDYPKPGDEYAFDRDLLRVLVSEVSLSRVGYITIEPWLSKRTLSTSIGKFRESFTLREQI